MTIQLPQHELPIESAQDTVSLTEQVAKTVAGIAAIGHARHLLEQAGHSAPIVANRITVDREVEACLVNANGRSWWQVYRADGSPPVWTVGALAEDTSNWIGCVEL